MYNVVQIIFSGDTVQSDPPVRLGPIFHIRFGQGYPQAAQNFSMLCWKVAKNNSKQLPKTFSWGNIVSFSSFFFLFSLFFSAIFSTVTGYPRWVCVTLWTIVETSLYWITVPVNKVQQEISWIRYFMEYSTKMFLNANSQSDHKEITNRLHGHTARPCCCICHWTDIGDTHTVCKYLHSE